MTFRLLSGLLLLSVVGFGTSLDMWILDADESIGTVNVATGLTKHIGDARADLTDIAFSPNGTLYGIDNNYLYKLDPNNDYLATIVGPLDVTTTNMRGLVFSPDGTLYARSNYLYRVDPVTGHATSVGAPNFGSQGDLAFFNGTLYTTSGLNTLVAIDTTTGVGTLITYLGISEVAILAAPANGTLYAVAAESVYSFDFSTGNTTFLSRFDRNSSLTAAIGAAFETESMPSIPTPEPFSSALTIVGGGLLLMAKRLKGIRRLGS